MGISTETKTIDGREFYVSTFPARKSISILSRLINLLGPGVAEGLKALAGKEGAATLDIDLDYGVAGSLIQELVARLDEDKVLRLILDMLEVGAVQMIVKDGEKVRKVEFGPQSLEQFDSEFAGALATVGKLVGFIVEVNYKDFFGKSGIGGLMGLLKKTKKSDLPSPTSMTD